MVCVVPWVRPVFSDPPKAHMLLRSRRANSIFEELKPGNLERECVEEMCDFEENFVAMCIVGNGSSCSCLPCRSNMCVHGTCVDLYQDYACRCRPGYEGRYCNQRECHSVFRTSVKGNDGLVQMVNQTSPISECLCQHSAQTATDCLEENGDCDHICEESEDGLSRRCSCLSGYKLHDDHRTCKPTGERGRGLVHLTHGPGADPGPKVDWCRTSGVDGSELCPCPSGDYERIRYEGSEVTMRVVKAFKHPDYNSRTVDNDIAMLRLESPAPFSTYIIPVCLPGRDLAEGVLHRNGTVTVVTGWGKDDIDSTRFSSALNVIKIPLVDHSVCAQQMTNNVSHNVLCAGILGKSFDACEGDSGGPMVTLYRNTWFLVGLVSWGEGCGHVDKLGIYTKVSNYNEWIHRVRDEWDNGQHTPTA
uniref:Vitamin K-dependent protein C n=1 Tax=Sphaeramia orbicularis TaxID=375764 RepID=A0A673BFE5_9TELE